MQIREATDGDIPEILKVLKASLGESSSKKTEEIWKFKHIDNPFGRSLVLVAVESNKIIGVRALMRWQWQKGDRIYKTFRAVDTATHPEHQGKGVFKKLTLDAIERAKAEDGDFIFNTPNQQSLPGYLKMGWDKVDNLKVQIRPTSVLCWFSKPSLNYRMERKASGSWLKELCLHLQNEQIQSNNYFTIKTPEYLKWRYEKNPLQSYQVFTDENIYIAGYLKQHKWFRELRIVEVLQKGKESTKTVHKKYTEWSKEFGATMVSFAKTSDSEKLGFSGNYGPLFTVRKLALDDKNYQDLLKLENFNYSLGDLELF